MISFLAQDIISTQKMELLLVQVWRSQRGRSRTWRSQHWGSCLVLVEELCTMIASIKTYKHQPRWSFRTLFTSPPPQSHSRTLCDGVYVCQKVLWNPCERSLQKLLTTLTKRTFNLKINLHNITRLIYPMRIRPR